MGDPVVVWAFDLPFIAVYRDYYAMVGSHLRKYIWLVTKKTSGDALTHKGFHFGEIVARPDKLPQAVNPKTTLHIDAEDYDWTHFKDAPSMRCVANNLILTYYHGDLTLTRPTNIAGVGALARIIQLSWLGRCSVAETRSIRTWPFPTVTEPVSCPQSSP
ncbi:hypothetical protein N7519_008718 [Penicillium mononematosum]|uniref:uncharacterized protein n=1 Tax=Penicillium mononematosum TaxID=268346 RepID=UPI0025490B7D|nr:uncharacterized protein N7519_008718 [Penicillium mononematosum]KAJ6178257.1 hypothetical protein N7519_008718 [Penicillium mononematosum]